MNRILTKQVKLPVAEPRDI